MRGSTCYGRADSSCEKYGRLYTGKAARRACPSGWRLPYFDDFSYLIENAGGVAIAGKKLKSQSGWSYHEDIGKHGSGTDDFGFSALPGGIYRPVGGPGRPGRGFLGAKKEGYYWSASEYLIDHAMYYYRIDRDDYVLVDHLNDAHSLSVRCITKNKDF